MVTPLVASDLDGTLLRSDGAVSPRTRAAIHALIDSGATFVYATGRPTRWVIPVAEEVGHHGLAVASNGALVIDLATGEILRETLFFPEMSSQVVHLIMDAVPTVTFAVDGADYFGHDLKYKPRWVLPPGVVVAPIDVLTERPFIKLLVREEDMNGEELLSICAQTVGHLASPTCSSIDGLIEITAFGTGKAEALQWIAERAGLTAADAVAFGDMPNDLGMLTWAGCGVAMANAHAAVLAVADEITTSNDDDGVARVIERILLG